MNISISAKNDYSYLFNSLNKSSGSNSIADMSWLSDYSSIKSGSYGKLLKAYYSSDDGAESTVKSAASKLASDRLATEKTALDEATRSYQTASNKAGELQKSISSVSSLEDDADDDAVYSAVSSYVKNYNELVDSAAKTNDSAITNRLNSIETTTGSYEKKLNGIGISIGNDGKLSLDKDTFATADKSAVKELFGRGSYGSNVNVSAAMIQSTANYDALRSGTYTAAGSYSSLTGSLWDSTT